ncbi:MAG: Mov34/MPN/PAD-1 family protein [Tenericutes bacterium]|nr:Mov34/MPN/PAD-1 family protein [Mycoplasmatota bacterium]
MTYIKFTSSCSDKTIYINEEVIQSIMPFRQNSILSTEAGGMMFGCVGKSEKFYYIEKCSIPIPEDTRTITGFIRSVFHAKKALNIKIIDNITTYLGEWHTHPCEAFLSSQDKKSHIDLLNSSKIYINGIFALIYGADNIFKLYFIAKDRNIDLFMEEKDV